MTATINIMDRQHQIAEQLRRLLDRHSLLPAALERMTRSKDRTIYAVTIRRLLNAEAKTEPSPATLRRIAETVGESYQQAFPETSDRSLVEHVRTELGETTARVIEQMISLSEAERNTYGGMLLGWMRRDREMQNVQVPDTRGRRSKTKNAILDQLDVNEKHVADESSRRGR